MAKAKTKNSRKFQSRQTTVAELIATLGRAEFVAMEAVKREEAFPPEIDRRARVQVGHWVRGGKREPIYLYNHAQIDTHFDQIDFGGLKYFADKRAAAHRAFDQDAKELKAIQRKSGFTEATRARNAGWDAWGKALNAIVRAKPRDLSDTARVGRLIAAMIKAGSCMDDEIQVWAQTLGKA